MQHLFQKQAESKKFHRGEYIYRRDEAPHGLYLVQSGLVGLVIEGLHGQEHLLRLFKQNQSFGHRALFAEENYHASAIALQTTEVLFLYKDQVCDQIRNDASTSFAFLRAMAKDLGTCERRLISRTELDVEARIAQSLLYLKDRYPEHRWTRKEIADFCGSTAPTVIKTLARFEDEGLISQEGREITILNRGEILNRAVETPE